MLAWRKERRSRRRVLWEKEVRVLWEKEVRMLGYDIRKRACKEGRVLRVKRG